MKEEWKEIIGYENLYKINNYGEIKNNLGETIKPYINHNGYKKVGLTKNKKQKQHFVHRLVAETFITEKSKFKSMLDEKEINLNDLKINHKDENKQNNCVNNLEWCTSKYNNNYGKRNKPIYQKDLNGKIIKKWDNLTKASNELNISISCISECLNYKKKMAGNYIWRWVEEKEEKPLFEINWELYEKSKENGDK